MSESIDVLAVLDAALKRLWDSVPVRQVWTREQLNADEQLKEARAAVAELIEAAEWMTDYFHKESGVDRVIRLRSVLDRVRGSA